MGGVCVLLLVLVCVRCLLSGGVCDCVIGCVVYVCVFHIVVLCFF